MVDPEAVVAILYEAIDDTNATLDGPKISKTPETVLFGKDALLDSVGLVNFVVTVEQLVEDRLGVAISLASEKAMSMKNSPFRTVASLADYVKDAIAEVSGG